MRVILVRFKGDERRDFLLARKTTLVGRLPECALRIQTADVSRRHCEIATGDDEVTIRDLGSSNGTFVNEKRVAAAKLAPGDRVMVGPATFIVQIDGQPEKITPVAGPTKPTALAPAAAETLTPSKGGDEEEIFELTADDFDLEDAISALDELRDEENDLP